MTHALEFIRNSKGNDGEPQNTTKHPPPWLKWKIGAWVDRSPTIQDVSASENLRVGGMDTPGWVTLTVQKGRSL